jgi:spore maturation protein CgeB
MNILIVSDRKEKKSKTDYLANIFKEKYDADILYTKDDTEEISLLDRVLNKLNIELDKSAINNRILKKLDEKNYDIIMIWKGNRIYPWTLKKIKINFPNIKLLSWSGDNMTKWHNKSLFYHFGINNYDVIFSVNIPDYKNIEKICTKPVYYFNKRADKRTHKPLNKERKEFKYDVLFIGSYEKERFKTLTYLAKNGIKIDIFGNMWNKCKEKIHPNLKVHYKELVGKDYVEAISFSKISLGFLRKINNDTQTSRTFEIPACGGFMLMERTDEHLKLFIEGKEAEFFNSDDELLKKVEYYLVNYIERERISSSGLKKVEKSGYYFENLVDEIMNTLEMESCQC